MKAKVYELEVSIPSPMLEIKMSPHRVGFWLLVNGIMIPRTLVRKLAHRIYHYPERSPDRKCLVGTRGQLAELPEDCFKASTEGDEK